MGIATEINVVSLSGCERKLSRSGGPTLELKESPQRQGGFVTSWAGAGNLKQGWHSQGEIEKTRVQAQKFKTKA